MNISEQLLKQMLEQQDVLNKQFQQMTIERVPQPEGYAPIITSCNGISRTEIFECEGKIILKRFIDSKLYKVEFTKDVSVTMLIDWFELEDGRFKLCCR